MDILDLLDIDPAAEASLAQQMKERLVWLIASGDLKAGGLLPPLRQVSEQLSVNINTVRSAYQKLEAEGLVEIRQGSRAKVLPADPARFARLSQGVQTDTIGVIVPSMSNPFYQSMLQGIEEEMRLQRPLLFVCNTHDSPEDALRYYLQLSARQVDGILIASHDALPFLTGSAGYIGAAGFAGDTGPLPLVSADWPGFPGYSVLLDLENAGYQATRHLLEHGHRRIGLITSIEDASNILPVNIGYQRALQEAGLEPDPELVARVPGFGLADGAEGARRLLARRQPPTALFAIADLLAIGAMSAIQQAGLNIPGDIAVAGFNDIPLAGLAHPPLTTAAAPSYEMGRQAVRMLQMLISGERPAEPQVTLPTWLVVRRSCGCP